MTEIPSKLYLEGLKAAALGILLVGLLATRGAGSRVFGPIERFFAALAARRGAAMALVALLPVAIRLAILPLYPAPEPRIHDEFGHLLLADTFASGRITNPPHPYAASFEAVYTLVRPTYTAQYQPALGLVLAGGRLVFGHPWAGILAATAAFGAALFWMLRGWLPPAWALLGSALAVLQTGVFDYWTNSYWGGTVPALGGTLVLGAVPRVARGPGRVRNALIAAAGLAIVMNSRPLEAFLLGLVLAGTLAWRVFRTHELPLGAAAAHVVLPAGLVLSASLAGMGYYNWRVTGSALEFPYMLHQKLYGTPQPFWWQPPVTVSHFPNREIEGDYVRQRMLHARRSSPVALLRSTVSRINIVFLFYLGVSLAVPLLFAGLAWRDRPMRFALAAGFPFVLDHLTFHAFYSHYAAPACPLLFLASVQCWRRMRKWKWGGVPAGLALSRALPAVAVAGLVLPIAAKAAEPFLFANAKLVRNVLDDLGSVPPARTEVIRQLEGVPGQHLVLVRYRPGHHPDNEWVRNDAVIDNSRIVWARELGRDTDRALIRYYGNRQVWLLDPDVQPVTVHPYPGATEYLRADRGRSVR